MPLGSINNILNKNILSHYNNEFIKINMHVHSYLSKCIFKFFRIFYSDKEDHSMKNYMFSQVQWKTLDFNLKKNFPLKHAELWVADRVKKKCIKHKVPETEVFLKVSKIGDEAECSLWGTVFLNINLTI